MDTNSYVSSRYFPIFRFPLQTRGCGPKLIGVVLGTHLRQELSAIRRQLILLTALTCTLDTSPLRQDARRRCWRA